MCSRASFAAKSTERTWLIGILRHKIFDQIRGSARDPAIPTVYRSMPRSSRSLTTAAGGGPARRRGTAIRAVPWRHANATHVLYRAACRRYRSQIKLIRGTLWHLRGRLETEDPLPGPGLPENTREKIKRALEEQSNVS